MAKDLASCIKITDRSRPTCVSCAEGKQTKNVQSNKDMGAHSPIDCIDGAICSDLKGPMKTRDRLGNRYLINFVDHKSNYCRVFLAKTKDLAAKKFEHFFGLFRTSVELSCTCTKDGRWRRVRECRPVSQVHRCFKTSQ